MAQRLWTLHWSYGYAGTDSEDEVELCSYLGISEAEAESMTDAEAVEALSKECWEQAVEQVEAYAEPREES